MEQTENQDQHKELSREQRLAIEESAIIAITQMGVKFSVPLKINPVNPPRWIRWWNLRFPKHLRVWRDKRIPKTWDVSKIEIPDVHSGTLKEAYVRNFQIKPLLLGAIDIIRQRYIEIEYNEDTIQDEPIQESKRLFRYIPLMAEIAAIAVLNETSVATPLSKEVKELKSFFLEHLTVQRLHKLADIVSQMMDPGGFTSSIRLIREIGVTKPTPKADQVE